MKLSLLCYSRSRFKDYRWIYQDSSLSSIDIKNLDNDFLNFDNQKKELLANTHLFVRKISIGYAVYKFVKRIEKDFTNTPIYALEGFTIKGSDAGVWSMNMSLALLKYLEEFPVVIPKLYDKDSKVQKEVEYSIEELTSSLQLENYKKRISIDEFLIESYNGKGFSLIEQEVLTFQNLNFENEENQEMINKDSIVIQK